MEGISSFFTDSLLPALSHDEARRRLIARRHVPLPPHPAADSRRLWYALLLFLYREEEGASDEVWVQARHVVLGLLRGTDLPGPVAGPYLAAFEVWAAGERRAWVHEVAGTLYNLEQIGRSVHAAQHPVTAAEWEPMHTVLRQDILDKMGRAGGDLRAEVLSAVEDIRRAHHGGVLDMLRQAYWEAMEQDVAAGRHESLWAQIHEVRLQLRAIVPPDLHASLLDPWLDLEYIAQRLQAADADTSSSSSSSSSWLVELEASAVRVLREYDSAAMGPRYDEALEALEDAADIRPGAVPVLRNISVLVHSLYQRSRAWRQILQV